ncbi:DPP IV N-terminal domain-containing protein [Phycisphaeraceae bacterium D3-23]
MQLTRTLIVLAGVSAFAGLPGCTQYYNGALGFSREDAATAQAYQRERAERERELDALHRALGGPHEPARIGFDGELQAAQAQAESDWFPVYPGNKPGRVSVGDMLQNEGAQAVGPEGAASNEQPVYVTTADVEAEDASGAPRRSVTPPRRPVGVYGDLPGIGAGLSPMDTTGQVQRISFSEEGADFDVSLDATRESLVFSSTRHRETSDIYRQRIGGQAVTQLTDDPGNDVMPCVSPDGETIVFASDRGGNWDLYLMDARGGAAVQLTNDSTHDIHPSFSPDGKQLVYCSFGERSGQWQLVVIDVENPATKRYIGHGLFPQWSPVGDTILFQRARERGTRWFGVWSVELNENGEAGSPTEIAWSPEHACITPAWSPDGLAVVFCTVSDPDADTQAGPASSDVWLVGADGSGRTRLTPGRFANLQPTWSADNTVYFVSNRGRADVENIWAIDGSDALRLVLGQRGPEQPATVEAPTQSD